MHNYELCILHYELSVWAVMDSNHRRLRQLSYSQPHLATLVTALINNSQCVIMN